MANRAGQKIIIVTQGGASETIANMRELVHFLWISFHDYFLIWLSGGGIVGACLICISLWERHRGMPMKRSIYFSILAVCLVVFATFSAWHDAEKNLVSVIQQRADDNSKLTGCDSDLRVSRERNVFLQQQINTLQTNINGFQSGMNGQQQTLNSCVVALGKDNIPKPLAFIVKSAITAMKTNPGSRENIVLFEVETNRDISPVRAKFVCANDFKLIDMTLGGPPPVVESFVPKQISATEVDLEMTIPAWSVQTPIFIAVLAHGLDPSKCFFMQR